MSTWIRGETYVQRASIRMGHTSNVTTPSIVSFKLTDPCNCVLVNYQSMTSDAVGKYYYNYTLSSSATYGRYRTQVKTVESSGHISIEEDEFYVMPWRLESSVRSISGISDEKSISDDDLSRICWMSYKYALRDVYKHYTNEYPNCNVETGAGFDGANSTFQSKHYPIADINGDGTISGTTSCATDVIFKWKDYNGHMYDGYVSISRADNGEIYLFKSDGVTPIPSDNKGVYLDYWVEYDGFDDFIFQQAVAYLTAHYTNIRFNEIDRVTIADINTNRQIMIKDDNRFFREYKRLINMIREPRVGVV